MPPWPPSSLFVDVTMSTLEPDDLDGWDGTLGDDLLDDPLLDDSLHGPSSDGPQGPSWGLLLGSLVAIVAIAFLVFDGLQGETFFFDVPEAVERADSLIGENIRVRGTVEPGSFAGVDGRLENRFRISEEGVSLNVVYHRALPDTFQEDSEVVVQGRLDESLVLHANEVLVKCPSRYEGAPPAVEDSHLSGHQAAR
jgi:cytochrome c-type biogenesis protein CcmE